MEQLLTLRVATEIDDIRIVEHPAEVAELENTQDARESQKARSMEERRKKWNEVLFLELTPEQRKAQEDKQRDKKGNLPANFRYQRLEEVQHEPGAAEPTVTPVKVKLAPPKQTPKRRCVRNRAPSEQEVEQVVWEDADWQGQDGEDVEEEEGAGGVQDATIVPVIPNRKESQGLSVVDDSQAPPVQAKTVLAPDQSLRAIIAGTPPEDIDKLPTYRLKTSEEETLKNEKGQDICFTTFGVFGDWKDLPFFQGRKFAYRNCDYRKGYVVQDVQIQTLVNLAPEFVTSCSQTFGRDGAYTTSPAELAIFANQCYDVQENGRVRNWELNIWTEDEAGECIILPKDTSHRVKRARIMKACEQVLDVLLIEDFDKKCFWYVQLDRVVAEEVAVVISAV